MTENDGRDESEQKAPVLIPLDAEEAMLGKCRFPATSLI
jgi:hypothetical protein